MSSNNDYKSTAAKFLERIRQSEERIEQLKAEEKELKKEIKAEERKLKDRLLHELGKAAASKMNLNTAEIEAIKQKYSSSNTLQKLKQRIERVKDEKLREEARKKATEKTLRNHRLISVAATLQYYIDDTKELTPDEIKVLLIEYDFASLLKQALLELRARRVQEEESQEQEAQESEEARSEWF